MTNPLPFLFPTPSAPPHPLSPPRIPGISPESTETLLNILKDNHQKWHVFFNERGFHNHIPHRALALWAIGAPGEVITQGYGRDSVYQKPMVQPPVSITDENFNEHLGDGKYYQGYVDFFTEYLQKHNTGKALEDYVFSRKANIGEPSLAEDKQPRMLARFASGLLHPIIHAGHGPEFDLPGILAEGLAQGAVHSAQTSPLVPSSLFDGTQFISKAKGDSASKLRALDIVSLIYDDLREEVKTIESRDADGSLGKHAPAILKYTAMWDFDVDKLGEEAYLRTKIEELAFLVTAIYGVGGWTGRDKIGDGKERPINADFFLMHLLTSSIFIPSLCVHISPLSRAQLLHTYMATILATYVFRRCPPIDIAGFYAEKPDETTKEGKPANPWTPLLEHAIIHHDEHLTKTQRALLTWASHFGAKASAASSSAETDKSGSHGRGVTGIDHLDGTLFLRIAELTAARLGPPNKDAGLATGWDLVGFP